MMWLQPHSLLQKGGKLMNKWAIIRVETNELIEIYKGTFMEVMNYLNKSYEDGDVDVEFYDNWLERQIQERSATDKIRDSFEESIANGWIYG